MWAELKINNQSYLFKCNVDEENIVYYLCDLKQVWCEKSSTDEIVNRSKELNKRIECDRKTVLETISTVPASVEHETSVDDEKILNFKYYLSNRPFKIKWILKLCPQSEFLRLVTNPLLYSLGCLSKQNEELKGIINKKDIEIEQYKIEGAVLKRNKVATEAFSINNFEANNPAPSDDFLQYVQSNFTELETACAEIIQIKKINTNVNDVNGESNVNLKKTTKKSPKKVNKHQRYQQLLLKHRQQKQQANVSYEDSDSCTPPTAEDDEIAALRKSVEELKRKQKEDLELLQMQSSTSKKPKKKFTL